MKWSERARPARDGAAYNAIDTYVEQQRRRLKIPGISLAIVAGDQIVHLRGFGRTRPGGEAPGPQTAFYIGSLTKSFTALAVMQLVEAGQVEPEAPLQHYLPWFRLADPQAAAQITVRHLLHQTSGLPTSAGETILADFDPCPGAAERQARALATLKLAHAVGAAWEYSNSNYQLLGLVVEAASGQTYADYIQEHILNPLAMRHTTASPAAASPNSLAVGHQFWFGHPVAVPHMTVPSGALAAGGLSSSAEDMARYLMAMLNSGHCGEGQMLSSAGLQALQRGAADVKAFGMSLGQYGMGWFVDKLGPAKLVWHSGTLPHFGAFMALLPEQELGVVLLFNACHHWMNPVLTDVGMGAVALLADQPPTPLPVVGLIPALLRGQLLLPALQLAGIAGTLRQLRRWRHGRPSRPSAQCLGGLPFALPLIPNLLAALALIPLLGKRRGYLRLYMPDYSWLVLVCGSLALMWSGLRTGLVVRAPRTRGTRAASRAVAGTSG